MDNFRQDKDLIPSILLLVVLSLSCLHFFDKILPWFTFLSFGVPPTSITLFSADPHIFWKHGFHHEIDWKQLNILGPVLLLKLLGNNLMAVFLFQLSLLIISIKRMGQLLDFNPIFLALFIVSCPFINAQIYFPNKEFYMFVSSMFLISYSISKQKKDLVFFLLLLVFTKIEFIGVAVGWLFFNKLSSRHWFVAILLLVAVISISYSHIPGMSGKFGVLEAAYANQQVKGLSYKLAELAYHNKLFFLVMMPTVALGLFANLIDLVRGIGSFDDSFHLVISNITLSLLLLLNLFCIIKYKYIDRVLWFVVLWLIVVATVPFPLHRYLFPIYPFLIVSSVRYWMAIYEK